MSTVRSIERRLYVRRQSDRDLGSQVATSGTEVPRHMDWNGVWTGYMAFVGFSVLLLAFVFGVGFSSLNPLAGSSWAGAGTGTLVWSGIVGLIALFIGAWVAGRTPHTTRQHGMMRGVMLWGLAMLSTLLLVGWLAGTALAATTGVAGAALGSASNISAGRVTSVLQQNGITGVTADQASTISSQLMAGDQSGAASSLANEANISTDRANTILGQVGAPVAGAASTAGRAVQHGGASLSWGLFWMALIGLGVSLLGGAMGGGGVDLRRSTLEHPISGQTA